MPTTFSEMLLWSLVFMVLAGARYLLMTGTYYVVVCQIFDKYLGRFKINKEKVASSSIRQEMKWALLNCVNFAVIGFFTLVLYNKGYLKVYLDIEEYGLLYAIAIVPVLLLLLDTYFYWTHYFMHFGRLAKKSQHKVHHQFHNISPWSAFSVHPIEGFLEILSRPLLLAIVPLHPYSIIAFLVLTFALNIIGHSGYEFFPRDFATHWFSRFKSSATFHYMHHQKGNYNLSLFFNFWDRIMGTMNPKYADFYAQVKNDQKKETVLESLVHETS